MTSHTLCLQVCSTPQADKFLSILHYMTDISKLPFRWVTTITHTSYNNLTLCKVGSRFWEQLASGYMIAFIVKL